MRPLAVICIGDNLSPMKRLGRYNVTGSPKDNIRRLDTIDQIVHLAEGMVGKELFYKELTGDLTLG